MVWDAFTHLDRWGMRLFPVLGETIGGLPLCTGTLQYGGSAVALVVIVLFVVPRCAARSAAAGDARAAAASSLRGPVVGRLP